MTTTPTPPRSSKRAGCFAPLPWQPNDPQLLALEASLSHDHYVRFVDQFVQQLDLKALFASYGGTGSFPHSPDRLLAVVLFQMKRGRNSPAQWFLDANENNPTRWLLRGLQPCRTCWYNFNNRVAPFIQDLGRQLLQWAIAAGITPAERGSLDGTPIAAKASRRKLVNEQTLQQRITLLDQAVLADQAPTADTQPAPENLAADNAALAPAAALCAPISSPPPAPAAEPADTLDKITPPTEQAKESTPPTEQAKESTPPTEQAKESTPRPGWMAPTVRGRKQQQRRLKKAQERMTQMQQRNRDKRSSKRNQQEKIVISLSDPEAALGLDKDKIFRPLYNVQFVRDLDSRLLLGYDVFAQPNDAGLLGPMLHKTKELLGHSLKDVTVDTAYTGGADLSAAAAEGVTVYASLAKESDEAEKKLSKSAFAYVADEDVYVCPEGKRLEYKDTSKEKRSSVELVVLRRYRCDVEHCRACPRQSECTTSTKQGRTVRRSEYEELVEELHQRMQTAEAQAVLRLRGQTVELANADVKEHRKLRRFNAGGLKRVRCQVGLMVLAHNLFVLWQHKQKAAADDHPEIDRNQCGVAA